MFLHIQKLHQFLAYFQYVCAHHVFIYFVLSQIKISEYNILM